MKNSALSRRIMRRIYAVYVLRRVTSPTAFRVYSLAAFSAAMVSLVSVGNIIANLPTGSVFALYDFSLYAFMHTELAVQLLVVGIVGFSLWLARDYAHYMGGMVFSRPV